MKNIPLLVLALGLSGCALTSSNDVPSVEIPRDWKQAASRDDLIAQDWWTSFQSPELNTLIERVLYQNNDVQAALHRVEQARADLKIAGATRFPSATATSGLGWEHGKTSSAAKASTGSSWTSGLGVTYELDLFGANKAARDSALSTYAANRYDHDALALIVSGDVAKTYFTVLSLVQRRTIAQENLKNARDVLAIVNAQYEAGAASEIETSQQKSAVSNSEAALSSLEKQEAFAQNALALLMGKAPNAFSISAQNFEALAVPVIAPTQPSTLLQRRPDIRRAEAELFAANADIGAARAAYFPTVNLGMSWDAVANPIHSAVANAAALSSAISAPLFQGGRTEGGVEKAIARHKELGEVYRKTVLTSFKEVEDALAAIRTSTARHKALETSATQAHRAYDLSRQRYEAGTIDFQTLLDSQKNMFESDDAFIQAKLDMLTSSIDLFKALGGGWSEKKVGLKEDLGPIMIIE